MTSRCYEELQAKLENQSLPPILSRETTVCTVSKKIVYYERSTIEEQFQLPTITDWNTLNNNLKILDIQVEKSRNLIQTNIDTVTNQLNIASSDAESKLLDYNRIVADELELIFTTDFSAPTDYDPSSNPAAANAYTQYSEAQEIVRQHNDSLQDLNKQLGLFNDLTIKPISNGETVSIFITGNILVGTVYKNIQGEFLDPEISEYYPFTIERISRFNIEKKNKVSQSNYLSGQLTKAQKWTKAAKKSRVLRKDFILMTNRCSQVI